MRGSILGSLAVIAVLYFGVLKGAADPMVFLNGHAIILVIGGTLAVTLMVYSVKKILDIFEFMTYGFLFRQNRGDLHVIEDLVVGLKEYSTNIDNFRFMNPDHPFTREGFHLLQDPLLTDHQIEVILKSRREATKKQYYDDAKLLSNISKFPPALGLLGASTGMIDMMGNLGKGGVETVGSAMAVALTATFWGIGLANLVILPLADYATRVAQEDLYIRDTIIEGILMAKRGYPERVITEHLIGKLPIVDRATLKRKLSEQAAQVGSEPPTYAA